jgi:hypothetical protein
MLWQVVARHNKRKRDFQVEAPTAEQAREDALHLIANYYAVKSGRLGNEVWLHGTVSIINEKLEQHTLY